MRTFSTLTLTWALALLAITTIISVTDADPCDDCIMAAAYAISPTCKSLTRGITADSGPLTEEQILCVCPLVFNDTWTLHCIKPELCTDQVANLQMTVLKPFRETACANAVAPTKTTDKPSSSAAGAPPTSTNAASRLDSSSKVAIGAVVAVFAALL